MKAWEENEELGRRLIQKGHKWERYVALFFENQGLEVELHAQTVRENLADIEEHSDAFDMTILGKRIEVKSRDVAWHAPNKFPYDPMNVDSVRSFDKKDPKPDYYINLSTATGAMVWVDVAKTRAHWTVAASRDRLRGIDSYGVYRVPLKFGRPIYELVSALKVLRTDIPYLR